ncbi:PREDICTED: serine/threonine-protein phosphatase 7 long form homolog [Nicotiana attenuata]|uniref:serine/threonine-protein phosphatase 7 long form homolog n=1 Tax=Nicotiana attenuata TaxID=49451 RepID=UPI000904A4E8|nr:PREDICTED: serine/threonine-protein phosphatase 7 long form homolog [Nicotiana attenuata]
MDAPIHPGPRTLDLLALQPQHRSEYIWDGQLLTQTFRARRVDLLWEFLSPPHVLHPHVVHYLEEIGLYWIISIGWIQLDYALMTALIERWRPETHTFHLPIGEATITLQDAEILYGLSADGLPVLLSAAMRYYSRQAYWDMLHMLMGFMPAGEEVAFGASPIYEAAVAPSIWGGLVPEHFGEPTEPPFSASYYPVRGYSWGGAVISYLYRQMCRVCIGTQRDVCGFLPLLQIWVWERILQFRPPLPQLPTNVEIPHLPLAHRWVMRRRLAREYDAHHNLPLCRDVLDLLEDAQR